jgi:stringent starvation protein B
MNMTTTRPYLIRAFYEWIADNNCTPYLAVDANCPGVELPMEYAENGRIILNISMSAVRGLKLDNDYIAFNAQFGGRGRDIFIPIQAVIAVYAKENGKGMVFTEEEYEDEGDMGGEEGEGGMLPQGPAAKAKQHKSGKGKKPNLTLVK